MAGSHHAQAPGPVTKTRAAVVLTVLVVALAIVGLYSVTHKSNTSTAKDAAKTVGAVTRSAPSTPAPSTSAPSTPALASTAPSTAASSSPSAAVAPLTYVVLPGDNLTVIAAWFHMHGYGELYDANKAVIGADPDLIHPGQRITISSGGMTTSN